MLGLDKQLILYHGSYARVRAIDLSKCEPRKDFGRGFYLTSSLKQARSFVPLAAKRHVRATASEGAATSGWVSTFLYTPRDDMQTFIFESANVEWLHYVVANRRGDLFPELLERFRTLDIIGGKIANDRTAQTIQFYMAGAYGAPGSPEADETAIRILLPNRLLTDQFCFRSERSLGALEYMGSEPYVFA